MARARPLRRPPGQRRTCVLATACASLAPLIASSLAFAPLPLRRAALPGRRESLASAGLGLWPALSFSSRSRAEEAAQVPPSWQIKLPDGWVPLRQSSVPGPGEKRTKELLYAGNNNGAEVKVLRIPLITTPQDPQGLGTLALIDYFSPQPRISRQQILDTLSKSFARRPDTFDFALKGDGEDKVKGAQKYFTYEFNLTRCEGQQVTGMSGKECLGRVGEKVPTQVYHHAVINTVTTEPSGGRLESGRNSVFPEVLWLVDISAPADKWPELSKQVASLVDTFAVGTVKQLEASRNATSTA